MVPYTTASVYTLRLIWARYATTESDRLIFYEMRRLFFGLACPLPDTTRILWYSPVQSQLGIYSSTSLHFPPQCLLRWDVRRWSCILSQIRSFADKTIFCDCVYVSICVCLSSPLPRPAITSPPLRLVKPYSWGDRSAMSLMMIDLCARHAIRPYAIAGPLRAPLFHHYLYSYRYDKII